MLRSQRSKARRNFVEMEEGMEVEHREEMRQKLIPKTIYDMDGYWDDIWNLNFLFTGGSD